MRELDNNEIYVKVHWTNDVLTQMNSEIDTADITAAAELAIQMYCVADVEVFLYRNKEDNLNNIMLDSILVMEDDTVATVYDYLEDGFCRFYVEEPEPVGEAIIENFYVKCPSLGYSHLYPAKI